MQALVKGDSTALPSARMSDYHLVTGAMIGGSGRIGVGRTITGWTATADTGSSNRKVDTDIMETVFV